MKLHKVLEKQLQEYLPENLRQDPALQPLFEQISKTYEKEGRDKLFYSISENLKYGVLLVSGTGEIIDCNQAFLSLLNSSMKPAKVLGMKECEFYSKHSTVFKNPEIFDKISCDYIKSRQSHFDECIETVDGRFIERDFSPIMIKGEYAGHLWSYRDITTRKKIQDAIVQDEATQRRVLNAAIDAIVIVNEKGLIEFWNKQAEKILGWSVHDVNQYFFSSLF